MHRASVSVYVCPCPCVRVCVGVCLVCLCVCRFYGLEATGRDLLPEGTVKEQSKEANQAEEDKTSKE